MLRTLRSWVSVIVPAATDVYRRAFLADDRRSIIVRRAVLFAVTAFSLVGVGFGVFLGSAVALPSVLVMFVGVLSLFSSSDMERITSGVELSSVESLVRYEEPWWSDGGMVVTIVSRTPGGVESERDIPSENVRMHTTQTNPRVQFSEVEVTHTERNVFGWVLASRVEKRAKALIWTNRP